MTDKTSMKEVRLEEKLDLSRNLVLATQHLLLMNAYIVPVILSSILGFSGQEGSSLIQSTFLASGLMTLLQARFFMKYPVVYGASFVPIGAIVGIYAVNGGGAHAWSIILGASLIGALTVVVLGYSNLFKKILDNLIPPIVGATIVVAIGISLIPLALDSQVLIENNLTMGQNILVAAVTIATMLIFSLIGSGKSKIANISRIGSGIFALMAGFLTAHLISRVDMSIVKVAPLISRPALPFIDHKIKFEISSIITMVVLYFILLTETTGAWIATSSATSTELTEDRVNRGVQGIGVVNVLGSLLGTTPMTGFSSNVGILTLTDVYSRHVFSYVGILLIIVGFSNKLSAFISIIPEAAIGGIFLITSGIITVSGISMYKELDLSIKDNYVISIAIIVSLALNLAPEELFLNLPVLVQYILGSSIASSAMVAIILNKIIPEF